MPEYTRDPELHYHRTAYPGTKVPHNWFRRGASGTEILATLDLCGQGRFTLLTGIGGEGWVEAAQAISNATGVEIETVVVGPGRDVEDIYGEWPDIREVSEDGCLLVRPDCYIGWRHDGASENAHELLADVMKQIQGK